MSQKWERLLNLAEYDAPLIRLDKLQARRRAARLGGIQLQPLKHLQYEYIEDHRQFADNVFLTCFSNGEEIVANYSEKPFAYKNGQVDPCAYKLFGSKK